jgi:hypothetical protein
VSGGTDDPATGPAGGRPGRPGPPPVPPPGRSDGEGRAPERDGEQRTGVVPFPLPVPPDQRHGTERLRFPVPNQPPQPADQPADQPPAQPPGTAGPADPAPGGPETGRLDLGGYPPRVPGARPRPDAARSEDADSGPGGPGEG